MADENATEKTVDGGAEPQSEAAAPEVDWKAQSRKWEDRAKANRAELDAANARFAESAGLAERVAELTAELDGFRAADARRALVADVARETGLSADVVADLSGATAEELTAQAQRIVSMTARPVYPVRTDDGGNGRGASRTTAQQFAEFFNSSLNRS